MFLGSVWWVETPMDLHQVIWKRWAVALEAAIYYCLYSRKSKDMWKKVLCERRVQVGSVA